MGIEEILLPVSLMLGAVLYSSVGHGGASAYIAIMALYGLSGAEIKPTALALNIAVSSLASYRYIKAGQFDLRLFVLVSALAVPFAYIGGHVTLPKHLYNPIVGTVLILSGLRFFFPLPAVLAATADRKSSLSKLTTGGFIGFISGLTGTGGGIFLSPLIILRRWCTAKDASGVAALFILLNSTAGLLGNFSSVKQLPDNLLTLVAFVLIGGVIGTTLGVRYFSNKLVARFLACVLIFAGVKFVMT